jgi:hypothetical protein
MAGLSGNGSCFASSGDSTGIRRRTTSLQNYTLIGALAASHVFCRRLSWRAEQSNPVVLLRRVAARNLPCSHRDVNSSNTLQTCAHMPATRWNCAEPRRQQLQAWSPSSALSTRHSQQGHVVSRTASTQVEGFDRHIATATDSPRMFAQALSSQSWALVPLRTDIATRRSGMPALPRAGWHPRAQQVGDFAWWAPACRVGCPAQRPSRGLSLLCTSASVACSACNPQARRSIA